MMWEQSVTARTGSGDPDPMREEEWTKEGRLRIMYSNIFSYVSNSVAA